MIARYVMVSTDPTDKTIRGGPILWDGSTALPLPAGRQLILESDAQAGGYTPPPRDPTAVNATALQTKAANALRTNTTYLTMSSPTQAQAIAQVNLLTRQCSGLIRLLLSLTDSTDGT